MNSQKEIKCYLCDTPTHEYYLCDGCVYVANEKSFWPCVICSVVEQIIDRDVEYCDTCLNHMLKRKSDDGK